MECQHLDELSELFLLGTLSDEDHARAEEHLVQGCESCLERLRDAGLTIYLLLQAGRPARPDPKLKSQLLRRLRAK